MNALLIVTLIEDDQLRQGVEYLLMQRGHMVSSAPNVEEARRRILRFRPDVVLVQQGLVKVKPSRFRVVEVGYLSNGVWSYDSGQLVAEIESR